MKKTIKIINILMIALMTMIVISNIVFAIDPTSITPVTSGDGVSSVQSIGGQVIGVIQVVGSVVAIGMLAVLGIKYMMGSSEEKAADKKSLLPYVIGAVCVFAAVNLASMVYNMAGQIS